MKQTQHNPHSPIHSPLSWSEIYLHKRLNVKVNNIPSIDILRDKLNTGGISKIKKLKNYNLYAIRVGQKTAESSRLILQTRKIRDANGEREVLVIVATVHNHDYNAAIRAADGLIQRGFTQAELIMFFNANEANLAQGLVLEEAQGDFIINNNSMIQIDEIQSAHLSSILRASQAKNHVISGAPGTGKTLLASLLLSEHAQDITEEQIIKTTNASAAAVDDDGAAAADPENDIDHIAVTIYIAKNQNLLDSMRKELENNRYSKFLLTNGKIRLLSAETFMELESLPSNTEMVLVDEYQNYEEALLTAIKTKIETINKSHEQHGYKEIKTVYFGDTDQTIVIEQAKSKLTFLAELYKNAIVKYRLEIPYRCAPEVKDIICKVINARQERHRTQHGSAIVAMNSTTESDHNRKGQKYITTNTKYLKNITESINYAIIVENENNKAEAKNDFQSDFIFTIAEVQGLEFEHVILYNMFDKLASKKEDTEQYYNSLIIATSRPSETIAIYQSHKTNARLLCEKLDLQEATSAIILPEKTLTEKDYKERIFYWIDRGNEAAAKSISEKYSQKYNIDKVYLYELCIAEREKQAIKEEEKNAIQAIKVEEQIAIQAIKEEEKIAKQQLKHAQAASKSKKTVPKEQNAPQAAGTDLTDIPSSSSNAKQKNTNTKDLKKKPDGKTTKSQVSLTSAVATDDTTQKIAELINLLSNVSSIEIAENLFGKLQSDDYKKALTILVKEYPKANSNILFDLIVISNDFKNKSYEGTIDHVIKFINSNNQKLLVQEIKRSNELFTALTLSLIKYDCYFAMQLIKTNAVTDHINNNNIERRKVLDFLINASQDIFTTDKYKNLANIVFQRVSININMSDIESTLKKGNILLAIKLIKKCSDIFVINNQNATILHLMSELDDKLPGYSELENLVFHRIGQINDRTKKENILNTQDKQCQRTALICAMINNKFSFAHKLIIAGASMSLLNNDNLSFLYILAYVKAEYQSHEYNKLLKEVLNKIPYQDKSLNTQDKEYQRTALMQAIASNKFSLARQLVIAGADISLADISSLTSIYFIGMVQKDHQNNDYRILVDTIVTRITNMSDKDKGNILNYNNNSSRTTPLMQAIVYNNFSFATKLIIAGASISNKGISNVTILHRIAIIKIEDSQEDYKNFLKELFTKIIEIPDKNDFLNTKDTIVNHSALSNSICQSNFSFAKDLIIMGANMDQQSYVYLKEKETRENDYINLVDLVFAKLDQLDDNIFKNRLLNIISYNNGNNTNPYFLQKIIELRGKILQAINQGDERGFVSSLSQERSSSSSNERQNTRN
jgi:hypothetical protein